MQSFRIRWEMDIEAETSTEAAEIAAKIDKSEHLFTIHDSHGKLLEEVDLAAIHEMQ